jgi:hypothetical protein
MTGRIKGEWERDDSVGKPDDGNPGWLNTIVEEAVYVSGDTGDYSVWWDQGLDGEKEYGPFDTKEEATERAKEIMRENAFKDRGELSYDEKQDVYQYYEKKIADNIDSELIHILTAEELDENYAVYAYIFNEDGHEEMVPATMRTSQHDRKVYADVDGVRDMIAAENFELKRMKIKDEAAQRVFEEMEDAIINRENLADIERDKLYGDVKPVEILPKVKDAVGEYGGRLYRKRTDLEFREV